MKRIMKDQDHYTWNGYLQKNQVITTVNNVICYGLHSFDAIFTGIKRPNIDTPTIQCKYFEAINID